MGHAFGYKPVREGEEVGGHGAECTNLLAIRGYGDGAAFPSTTQPVAVMLPTIFESSFVNAVYCKVPTSFPGDLQGTATLKPQAGINST